MASTAFEEIGDAEVLDVFGQEKHQNRFEPHESLQNSGVRNDGSGNYLEFRGQRIQVQNLPVYGQLYV